MRYICQLELGKLGAVKDSRTKKTQWGPGPSFSPVWGEGRWGALVSKEPKLIKVWVMMLVVVGLVRMLIMVGQSCGCLFEWDEVMNLPQNWTTIQKWDHSDDNWLRLAEKYSAPLLLWVRLNQYMKFWPFTHNLTLLYNIQRSEWVNCKMTYK